MKILITGVAGFIGFHAAKKLIKNYDIIGIDNLNNYYDVELKKARLNELLRLGLDFKNLDITNTQNILDYFKSNKPTHVLHLAAQAGVRYSIENPHTYATTNICGFLNILEGCRHNNVVHLIYASSSSVYGLNQDNLFSEEDHTDHPSSLYAASKKSNELMAHSYSHLFDLPTTGLRFFTVYGPYGRPDMAYYSFTKAIHEGRSIDVFNHGDMKRDFTYIDDIVDGILKVVQKVPRPIERASTNAVAPFRVFNIGNNNPVPLSRFIQAIEAAMSKQAVKNMLPMQSGDVPLTYADIDDLVDEYGFHPSTSIEKGISKFVKWYLSASSL